jgi:hypothetical protein
VIFLFGKFWIVVLLSLFSKNKKNNPSISNYPFYILTNAYISAVVVMLIDPIASRTEWWKWFEPTPFLGVPVGEIYGIFISVVFISTLIWILHSLLSKYFEKPIYISKNLNRYDLIIFVFYEIYCLVGTGLTIAAASDNNDVLMGVFVIFLATQIMPFVTVMIFLSSDEFNNYLKQKYTQNSNIFSSTLILMIILSGIASSVVILSILPQTSNFFPPITSIHMILTQFALLIIGFTVFLNLKIKHFKQTSD